MPPLVSVVIVSWNSARYLERCLSALSLQVFRDFEVIMIDNGSTDGSVETVEEKWKSLGIQVKKLGVNRGFAAANNIGAQLACGEWLALLNSDAFPEPGWLENLVRAAQEHPEYTFFASRQVQANHATALDGAGDAYHVSGLAWRRFYGFPIDRFGLDKEEVFGPCGAAGFYARKAFFDAGGFDEDFFSYHEDVDLAVRLRLRGSRCLYIPEASVFHVGSASLGHVSDFAVYHVHRNIIWSYLQNMPFSILLQYIFVHVIANIIYAVYYTLKGKGKAFFRAKWDALLGIPKALAKRKKIQERRVAREADLLNAMEQGWLQPYTLGHKLRAVLKKGV